MPQVRTVYYAMPPESYFWKWSDSFEELELIDGRTCSVWDEIQPILTFLAGDMGLPPFGAIVLIVSSCRENPAEVTTQMLDWLKALSGEDSVTSNTQTTLIQLDAALKIIRELPKSLKESLEAKCAIIEAIFEFSPQRLSPEESAETVDELTKLGPKCLRWSQTDLTGVTRFHRDTKGIIKGLESHTRESFQNRLRTGISDIAFQPADVVVPVANDREPTSLLEALERSGEEGAIMAGVAQRAIAMIHFPGKLDRPDEIPVGGISDITNRGTIDRLLPAELAYDDLTLAVRLINGEALYYRREVPPQNSPRKNALFVDRGLRLWGVSRLLSLGVALGILQQPQWESDEMDVFAVAHHGWCSLDLSELEQIKKILTELIPAAGPAEALSDWWTVKSDEINGDVVLITIREHLSNVRTVHILSEISGHIQKAGSELFVVVIDRDGSVEMESWSPSGVRPCFKGEINLDDILVKPEPWRKPSSELVKEIPEPANSYPFYRLSLPPTLFPVSMDSHESFVTVPDGIVGFSGNRILRWAAPGKGGKELCSGFPGSRKWLHQYESELILTVSEKAGEPMKSYRVYPGSLKAIAMEPSRHSFARTVQIDNGALIFGYSDCVEAFSLDTGERVTSQAIKELPANPAFLFDGTSVEVLSKADSDKADFSSLEMKQWNDLFVPSYIEWNGSELLIFDEQQYFMFDPEWMPWSSYTRKVKAYKDMASFKIHTFNPMAGIDFKKARLGGGTEVLYDSRGILHIRNLKAPQLEPISILLLNGATSVWSNSTGLLSLSEDLLPPGVAKCGASKAAALKKSFPGLFNQSAILS